MNFKININPDDIFQMEIKNEYLINGRKWWRVSEHYDKNLWTSDYFSSDGDGIELYIDKGYGGFDLKCFSGVPASYIYIDVVDFGIFQFEPNKIDNLDFKEPFILQSLRIADYLCRKLCKYH